MPACSIFGSETDFYRVQRKLRKKAGDVRMHWFFLPLSLYTLKKLGFMHMRQWTWWWPTPNSKHYINDERRLSKVQKCLNCFEDHVRDLRCLTGWERAKLKELTLTLCHSILHHLHPHTELSDSPDWGYPLYLLLVVPFPQYRQDRCIREWIAAKAWYKQSNLLLHITHFVFLCLN